MQQPLTPTLEGVAGRAAHGVAYWADGADRRILSLRNTHLYALDADSGRPVPGFGNGGRVDLTAEGARRANGGSSPIVVGDVVVVAGTVDGAGDSGVRWKGSTAENVRGYDVRTGHLRWTFHVVPQPGEFGADTWGAGSLSESGDLGAWCCLSADPELGYVYVPLTAPTAAYYGGHRPGDNLFSNSLVVLNAETGERVWHFQMVHHDLWEYDTIGPPTLGEITVDGRTIRAVMQPSKTGFLYVFDRVTGCSRCGRSRNGRSRPRPCRASGRRRPSRSRQNRRRLPTMAWPRTTSLTSLPSWRRGPERSSTPSSSWPNLHAAYHR